MTGLVGVSSLGYWSGGSQILADKHTETGFWFLVCPFLFSFVSVSFFVSLCLFYASYKTLEIWGLERMLDGTISGSKMTDGGSHDILL